MYSVIRSYKFEEKSKGEITKKVEGLIPLLKSDAGKTLLES